MNCKNYWKTHNNYYTARESNNFNKSEKLYDAKKNVVKMAKKNIKIIFELINVYEMMIKREEKEINVMYKKNEE